MGGGARLGGGCSLQLRVSARTLLFHGLARPRCRPQTAEIEKHREAARVCTHMNKCGFILHKRIVYLRP